MTITLHIQRRTLLLAIMALAIIFIWARQASASVGLQITVTPGALVTAVATVCPPTVNPRISPAAVQLMERGWIIWHGDTRKLYVLTMSATNKLEGSVAIYPENWEQGMPETTAAFVAPAGLHQPIRGIGKMWRENPAVRTSVGWALKDAEGLMMVVTQQGDTLWFNGDHDAFKITGSHWQEYYDWPRAGF